MHRRHIEEAIRNEMIHITLSAVYFEVYHQHFYNQDTFHNIRIKARDEWKMAFNYPLGCFQFKVLPFGLQGAPAIFMQFINEVLYLYWIGLLSEPGSNCHQFIPSFVQIAFPITNLLKMKGEDKSKPSQLLKWILECQAALRET